ncbi:MAG: type III secretion system export apparatus subunit SctS [Chlamydiia bacterium]|nr:type III secretion system export apparatus subunit SctS [Chlamydiia bacterium]
MFKTQITQLAYQGLLLILILSAPPILTSMVFGLFVAIFQAATQIQEQTLSFTIKLVAVVLVLMLMGGWLGAQILAFGANIFENFARWTAG